MEPGLPEGVAREQEEVWAGVEEEEALVGWGGHGPGPELAGSFLQEKQIDRILFFLAPKLIGGADAPGLIGGAGIRTLREAVPVGGLRTHRIGGDLLIEGYPEYS